MDVLIMLDCTGSMDPFIDTAKTRINSLVRTVKNTYPNVVLRIGFVGYRDHCDRKRLSVLPFTTDVKIFAKFVGT